MPAPSSTLTTLRPELGSMMEFDLEADRGGFIGMKVMPAFNVSVAKDTFGKIPIEALLQQRDTKRASTAGYSRASYEFTEHAYSCVEHGAEELVDDRQAKLYESYFDAEVVAAQRSRDVVMRNHEIRVATKLFDTNTYTPTDATAAWSDHDDAVPLGDVELAVQKLYAKGIKANALVIGWAAFRNLRLCDQVKAEIEAAGAGSSSQVNLITAQKLAEVFDLNFVFVGGAQKNSAKEGQNVSLSQIWDTGLAAVIRVPELGNDISEPCWGRTFHYAEDGSEVGGLIETYREDPRRSTVVRCRMDTDENVLYSEACELIDITPGS